jgi:multidrug efflux pump
VGLSYLVPGGFVPAQDKQYLVGFAQLPSGASLDRTEAVIRRMGEIALKQPGVESAVAFPGLSINGFTNSSSAGIVFVTLKPFAERKRRSCRPGPSPAPSTSSTQPSRTPSSPCFRRRR